MIRPVVESCTFSKNFRHKCLEHKNRRDVRPLLVNGLIIQTDGVLLYTTCGNDKEKSEAEILEMLELFLHTVSCHNMSLHPNKCNLHVDDVIYCGNRVTRDGMSDVITL